MALVPFATMESTHVIFLVVTCCVCFSWAFYLSKSKGAATFGAMPKDKGSATESVAWMVFVSVGGSFVIILAALTILNALELFDVMIAAGTAVASARMIVPCASLGINGIRFLRLNAQ